MVFTIEDFGFKTGKELTVTGKIKPSCENFSLNFGHDEENIAFHFNPRFNYLNDVKTIVCNSKTGKWCEEGRFKNFPFEKGSDFKVTISFNHDFIAKLKDGSMITFPNRFKEELYNHMHVDGDVTVTSLVFA